MGTQSEVTTEWGRTSLVHLVIACPCALVNSTLIAVVCDITAAARKEALIKGEPHLETLAELEVVALVKTAIFPRGGLKLLA